MAINVYDVGDVVRVSGAFTDADDVAADPSGVQFAYEGPDGVAETLVYGTDAELVKASTGNYYVDLTPTTAGDWHYRWIGTGTGAGAQLGQFSVRPNQVA